MYKHTKDSAVLINRYLNICNYLLFIAWVTSSTSAFAYWTQKMSQNWDEVLFMVGLGHCVCVCVCVCV